MATPIQSFKLPTNIFNATLVSRILNMWFEKLPADARLAPREVVMEWFGMENREQFDSKCNSTGVEALEAIGPSKLALPPFTTHAEERKAAFTLSAPFRQMEELKSNDWNTRAKTGLSLVLLLDQLPRNIFRNEQWKIYSHYDRLARALVLSMIHPPEEKQEAGQLHGLHAGPKDWELALHRVMWFYMPLMHSEDLQNHDEYTKQMTQLKEELKKDGDEAAVKEIEESLSFEVSHRAIIERFGRYPYRNEALGRETTTEEAEWRKEGNDFGTGGNTKKSE